MPAYLYQLAYTPEAWATQVKNPQDRIEKVRPAIEALGGTIVSAYTAFGDYDIALIMEMPDNVSAAAFAMAVAAGGAARTGKTTPLMTIPEAMEAMKKAGVSAYRPPA